MSYTYILRYIHTIIIIQCFQCAITRHAKMPVSARTRQMERTTVADAILDLKEMTVSLEVSLIRSLSLGLWEEHFSSLMISIIKSIISFSGGIWGVKTTTKQCDLSFKFFTCIYHFKTQFFFLVLSKGPPSYKSHNTWEPYILRVCDNTSYIVVGQMLPHYTVHLKYNPPMVVWELQVCLYQLSRPRIMSRACTYFKSRMPYL